ncbi:MAG: cobalamin-binding protein [Bryobacterales bacterium]|nr:cobalamin-binding protein [Bryobacterales bacterium]
MKQVAAFLFFCAAAAAQQRVVSNAQQRIVSTVPSVTEILYALGLDDRVVGVTRFCRYPPEAQQKPQIGDYINPNLEAIASLRPDLVIIQTNPVRLAQRLAALRLRSLEVNQENIDAIYRSIRVIGKATGTESRGEQQIAALQKGLEAIHARSARLQPTRVMFVVGRAPNRLDGLIVVGKASYLNELIALAGGENIFTDAVAAYPQISLEEVLARNPEVILDFGDMANPAAVTDAHKRGVVSVWQRAASLEAVKNHRVHAVAADLFVVPGPRAIQAAQAIFDLLHPGLH